MAISLLNDNIVLAYWLPGDDEHSGLSLIGTSEIDESLCIIIDYLRERGEPARLVHVPEFVTRHMRYPELFTFTEERDYDECVVPVSGLYPLSNSSSVSQAKIEKFLQSGCKVEVKNIDLTLIENQSLLMNAETGWWRQGSHNDVIKFGSQLLHYCMSNVSRLGLDNACLYIDGILQAYLIYQRAPDRQYAICYLYNVNYDTPNILEIMAYEFAEWFDGKGIVYANVDSDLGLPLYRAFRLKLGPANFFRKYRIQPV